MWNTSLFPGTDTDEFVDVHQLTRAFTETTATWNQAAAGVPWTTPGGDFRPAALAGDNGFTNDPEWACGARKVGSDVMTCGFVRGPASAGSDDPRP